MAYYIILFVITAILAWLNTGNTKVSKPFFLYILPMYRLVCWLVRYVRRI